MSERALRYRLGLFVLLALILLGTLIVLFGGSGSRWFKRTNSYTVTFTEAPGLSAGTPVRRSGVRVGEVTDVKLDDETGLVKATVAIENRFTVRRNEKPMLSTGVIGGDTVIDFIPEKEEANKPPLDHSSVPPGSTIAGEVQATVGTLLARASDVVPTTQDLMNDIRKSLQRLEKITPDVEATLREYRELARETRTKLLPEVRGTNAQVQEFVKSVQDVVPDVKKAAEAASRLFTTLDDAAPEVKETNRELQKLIKSANEAFPDFRKSMLEFQKFIAALNESVPEMRKTNKDLQELIKQATDVMPDLKTTIRDLGAAAQQYNKLGESLDKLVKDNSAKVSRIIDNLNAALDRTLDLLSNENRRNVADTLRNVRNASERLPETSKNLDEAVKEGRDSAKRLRSTLDKADEALTSLRDVMKPLGERGPNLLRNLDETFDKSNKIFGDLRELTRVLGESDGTFRRLINDPSLYNNLDQAACTIAKTIPRLDRILKDFETFADKLARHPEAIGLGGVVKPGSGLKDPPAPYPGRVVAPH